jgi:hypothetical protein
LEDSQLKPTLLLFCAAACAIPDFAAPISYTMTFTGGLYSNSVFHPLAPTSGSFTYDSSSGFSNFIVDYDGDVFNLTASANAPSVCATLGNCVTGTPAEEFQMLMTDDQWSAFEPPADGGTKTNFLIGNDLGGISADAAVFPGFGIGSPPRTGTFSLTLTSSVPEPATLKLLWAAALGFLGVAYLRSRKRAKHEGVL